MNAHRIDILYEAYSYHIAFAVSDNFKLKLFPAEYGFFNEYLSYERSL